MTKLRSHHTRPKILNNIKRKEGAHKRPFYKSPNGLLDETFFQKQSIATCDKPKTKQNRINDVDLKHRSKQCNARGLYHLSSQAIYDVG